MVNTKYAANLFKDALNALGNGEVPKYKLLVSELEDELNLLRYICNEIGSTPPELSLDTLYRSVGSLLEGAILSFGNKYRKHSVFEQSKSKADEALGKVSDLYSLAKEMGIEFKWIKTDAYGRPILDDIELPDVHPADVVNLFPSSIPETPVPESKPKPIIDCEIGLPKDGGVVLPFKRPEPKS